MNQDHNNLLQAALEYAERGLPVFPCTRDKNPITENGFYNATTDPEQIKKWWRKWPDASIGMRTGEASGFWVLDVDNYKPEGSKSFEALLRNYGDLPETRTSRTGGGGYQYFFKYPGFNVKSRNGYIGPGLDVKADGGYVILPPSGHPSGGQYEWIDETPAVDAPEWLIELVKDAPKQQHTHHQERTTGGSTAYALRALEAEAAKVGHAPEGSRNETLNQASFALGQLVAGGELSRSLVENSLLDAALSAGLSKSEARKTLASGLKGGMQHPRSAPEQDSGDQKDTADHKKKDAERPKIRIIEGKLPQMTDQAENILISESKEAPERGIYHRGNQLVRIISADAGDTHGVFRKEQGAKIIHPVDAPHLQDRLTRNVDFEKFDVRSRKWIPKNCPRNVAETLLARVGEWRLPKLRAIIETPILRPDGTILDTPGYDFHTGFLFIPNYQYKQIPKKPTRTDAENALKAINEAIKTFPFNTAADQSVAVAAMATALIRPSLPTAPLIGFTAPVAGTGKSKFVDAISIIATGKPAAVIGQGGNDEETEKRLHSALLQGDRIINIDNVERGLKGQALCQMVTQTIIQARILGQSKKVDIPSTATFFATGNNLTFSGDMLRRVLLCRFDPKCERPEERQFDQDFLELVRERRNELVNACLIILRAYFIEGQPPQKLTPMGSFEAWSEMVRNALVWLNMADPYLTREYIREADPAVINQAALFQAWYSTFGAEAVTVKDAVNQAISTRGINDELYEAMINIAGDKTDAINTRHLGNWMRKHEDQIVEGLLLTREGEYRRAIKWKIIEV